MPRTELGGERLVLVGIHLGQAEAALYSSASFSGSARDCGRGPHQGAQSPRGRAPGGSLDDFLHEVASLTSMQWADMAFLEYSLPFILGRGGAIQGGARV
jgi:hypothetical protein